MSWLTFHAESERLAAAAGDAIRSGHADQASALYFQAAEFETQAINSLQPDKQRTIGVTTISAVALWYKANEYAKAAHLAHQWLATGNLPTFASEQLRDLLQVIWSAEAAARVGIGFIPGDVLVAVRGGQVVHGGAPLELIIGKIDQIQSVLYRTIEMLLNHPLRRRGAPPPDVHSFFRPWLFQAPAGSYQFSVRVQEPQQWELFPGSRPTVQKVTGTFLAILGMIGSDPARLPEVVTSDEYSVAFLNLARNLAPVSGGPFGEISIRDAAMPSSNPVGLTALSRDSINAALRERRQVRDGGQVPQPEPERLSGTLRAVHLDKDWLEIATGESTAEHIRIFGLGEVLDDVIGPMVNKRVEVRARRIRSRLSLVDIELQE